MSKTITQYRTAKRHDVRLIQDPDEIEKITGSYSHDPRPRCGKCLRPTEILRNYKGDEIVRWCSECKYIWILVEFEKTITVTEYRPWSNESKEE